MTAAMLIRSHAGPSASSSGVCPLLRTPRNAMNSLCGAPPVGCACCGRLGVGCRLGGGGGSTGRAVGVTEGGFAEGFRVPLLPLNHEQVESVQQSKIEDKKATPSQHI